MPRVRENDGEGVVPNVEVPTHGKGCRCEELHSVDRGVRSCI